MFKIAFNLVTYQFVIPIMYFILFICLWSRLIELTMERNKLSDPVINWVYKYVLIYYIILHGTFEFIAETAWFFEKISTSLIDELNYPDDIFDWYFSRLEKEYGLDFDWRML